MSLWSEIVQYTISGITSGSIFAIIGICWSFVYLIAKVMNFATGEFVMLGGMITWSLSLKGFGLLQSAVIAILSTTVIAAIVERTVIRPIKHGTELTYIIATIACASVIKGIALLMWGSETRLVKPFFKSEPFQVLGATLNPQVLCVIGYLVIVTGSLALLLNYTLFGKGLRTCALNQINAELIGVDTKKMRLFCFMLAGGLASATGIVTAPITFTGYEVGLLTGLKGLIAAIVGNWTMIGTVSVAMGLGLVEAFSAGFISSGLKDLFTLLIVIIFLVLRTLTFLPGRRWIK